MNRVNYFVLGALSGAILLVSVPSYGCEAIEKKLDRADELIDEQQLDDAAGVINSLDYKACAVQPLQVGRLYMLQGEIALLQDKRDLALRFFHSAHRIGDVEVDDRDRGVTFKRWWEHAKLNPVNDKGALSVSGVPDSFWTAINGDDAYETLERYELKDGFHIFQVGATPGKPQYGRSIEIETGATVSLSLADKLIVPKAPKKAPAKVVAKPPKEKKPARSRAGKGRPSRTLVWAGGTAAALGLAQFGVAYWAEQKFLRAASDDEAKGYLLMNHATVIGGATASAVGTGLIVGAVVQGKW
jgi:hypothetical protein